MPEKRRWKLQVGKPAYGKKKARLIAGLEEDLRCHMRKQDPKRYAHSLSVALTAEQMALIYNVDPFQARVAGILHDWDKILSKSEQLRRARELKIDLGVELSQVRSLLHGMTAARTLPKRYPELPKAIWQAIDRHTLGHADMEPLDAVLFVADGIEPLRKDIEPIRAVRAMVDAREPLDKVYWRSFYQGVSYVIMTERYLYPGTLTIYNKLALTHMKGRG